MRKRIAAVMLACMMSVSAGTITAAAEEQISPYEVASCETEVSQSSRYEYNFVLDRTITDKTTELLVVYDNSGCVVNPEYKNASLVLKADGKILFQKKCTTHGLTVGNMYVKIPKQKAGTKIQIYLQSKTWKSNVRTVTVKNINTLLLTERTDRINKPELTQTGYKTYVKARKGQSLVISNGKKIVKTIRFKENNNKYDITEVLNRYQERSELFLYTKQDKKYSKGYIFLPLSIAIAE